MRYALPLCRPMPAMLIAAHVNTGVWTPARLNHKLLVGDLSPA